MLMERLTAPSPASPSPPTRVPFPPLSSPPSRVSSNTPRATPISSTLSGQLHLIPIAPRLPHPTPYDPPPMNRSEGPVFGPDRDRDVEGAQRRQMDDNTMDAVKDARSPRFRAIIRATSGRMKRHGGDIKSFSHELNSKGAQHYRYHKLHGRAYPQDVLAALQARFTRLKEEVNSELGDFAGDLVGLLEKTADEHPEWSSTIEDLLVVARECAEMSPDDFRDRCEGIVQGLDDRRQELPVGPLKQIHTRILFILTRCTRLLQFQKEGPFPELENVLSLYQSSDLGIYRDPGSKRPVAKDEFSKHMPGIGRRVDKQAPRERISSWKPFPSVAEKKKEQRESDASPKVVPCSFEPMDKLKDTPVEDRKKIGIVISPPVTKPQQVLDDRILYDGDSVMICRICDLDIPKVHVEEHSRICTIADRCDYKGLTIDERLERVLEVLEKVLEAYGQKHPDMAAANRDPMQASTSIITEVFYDAPSEQNILSGPSSVDAMEASPDVINAFVMSNFNELPTLSCKTRCAALPDLGFGASSSGSMTPQSQLSTPRATQIEVLLTEHGSFSELESFEHIHELLDIVQCILNTKSNDYSSLEYLQECLQDLQYVIQDKKVDALIVETFGRRVEKLLQEKFANILRQIDDGKGEPLSIYEDGSTESDNFHVSKTSPASKLKDRTTIEDFEIIKPISRGAFGRVFLAKKRVTGDLFAIKVLKKSDMIRKNAVESILAERNILISVRNPFVVRFFYSFTCRENLYLVMEYLNGGDLYSLLRILGCLSEDMARMYIAEIVLALEYLHSLNIIHRDLKPDNLLIAHDGHIKLTDFGLSKVGLINSTDDLSGPDVSSSAILGDRGSGVSKIERSQKREQRQKQCVVGTPDYLAPEILLGMPHGKTADWWSVGIILFELLVGIPPFNAEHPQEIFDNIMNRDIPWPLVPEEMSYDGRDLIDKLLIENPMQRLGATGSAEVKRHSFFRSINWDKLAQQKAAFIPATEGDFDTSYFTCRHSWNSSDIQIHACNEGDDVNEMHSMSCCSSPHSYDQDEEVDECSNLTEFGMSNYMANYSFSNFSYKNLSQLASINYSLIKRDNQGAKGSTHPQAL